MPAEQGEDDDFPSPSLPKKSLSDVSVSIVDKAWNVDTNDVTKTCDRLSDSSSQLNCSGDNVDDTTMKTNAGSDTPEAGKSVSASSSAPELTVNPKGKTSRESEYLVLCSCLVQLLQSTITDNYLFLTTVAVSVGDRRVHFLKFPHL